MATLAPKEEWLAEISFSSSRFGNVPKGSVLFISSMTILAVASLVYPWKPEGTDMRTM